MSGRAPAIPPAHFTRFGDFLKYLRRRAQLSQREVAIAVGYSEMQISRLERDQQRPDPHTLMALFVPALDLEEEPELVARLLELASVGRTQHTPAEQPVAQVERLDEPSGIPIAPTISAGGMRRQQLPTPATPFIGREREIGAVVERLRDRGTRLLTVTGPGGTGKTRLSLQVATAVLDDFVDGVWFVDLSPIHDPAFVLPTIASAFDVREGGGQSLLAGLQSSFSGKELLLILDNFEQVLAAALVLADLLQSAPGLKLLVTSRSVLGVYGEHIFAMPPLSLPDRARLPPLDQLTQYESVQLFIQRAQAAKADFAITDASAPAVAEICHRLDGLPLAIELAAARIRLLPPDALLGRLASRLHLLTGGARTLPARQQTLRNAIAWSYDLLDGDEQVLFRRLGIFVGGWTMETAEAVSQTPGEEQLDILNGLQSLLDKSLLRLSPTADSEPRFTMLETIREYAVDQLNACGEADATAHRHAACFLQLAEEAAPRFTGPYQQRWLDRIALDHDNLRVALAWTLDNHHVEYALRLAAACEGFWYHHGYWHEGRTWLTRALAHPTDRTALRGRALLAAAELAYLLNDYPEAITLFEESSKLFWELEDDLHIGLALQGLANVLLHQHDYERARLLYEQSLPLMRAQGNNLRVGFALSKLGDILFEEGDIEGAAPLFEESLAFYRKAGDTGAIAAALTYAGGVERLRGNLGRARALCEEALLLCRQLNHKLGIAWALRYLGAVAQDDGDLDQATVHFDESLRLRHELHDREGVAWTLEGLAEVACTRGQLDRAARLWGQAEAIREVVGAALSPADRTHYDRRVADARIKHGEQPFAAAWQEGKQMSLESAVACALQGEAA